LRSLVVVILTSALAAANVGGAWAAKSEHRARESKTRVVKPHYTKPHVTKKGTFVRGHMTK
jgi:hypothetical protein